MGERWGVTRDVLADVLIANHGVIVRVAHELGVRRDTVFDWIRAWHLWPLVNRVRQERHRHRRR